MFLRKQYVIPIFLFIFVLLLYIHNLSRSTYGGDVGDFLAASYVAGVPHPPGYPLFTLLGFLLTRLPFNQTPAFMVGLISAFSGAIAVTILYIFILKVTKNIVVSILTSLILAFSYYFWLYNEVAEVFALNNLFAILLFYFAYLFSKNGKKKTFFLLSFFTGLSFTNHHTIILILPSLALLIFPQLIKLIKKNPKILIKSFFLFLIGFSVYLYIPIASSRNPVINWGNVNDLESFLHVLFRKDYGTFNAGLFDKPSLMQHLVILKNYLRSTVSALTPSVVLLSFIGAVVLFRKQRLLAISIILAYVLTGPFFVLLAGFPLYGGFLQSVSERFFILSMLFICMLFPSGIIFVTEFIGKFFHKNYIAFFQFVFFLIPILLFIYNFPKTNLSNIYIGDNVAYDYLSTLPKNAVIFLSGDTLLFNTWYVNYAKGFRPDIRITNFNGIVGDSFFPSEQNKLAKKYPKLSREELFIKTITQISKKYPVYSAFQMSRPTGQKFLWIPYGLAYKLSETGIVPSKEEFVKKNRKIWQSLHIPNTAENKLAYGNLGVSEIPSVYATALLTTGNFIVSQYKDNDLAKEFYKRALKINPDYAQAYAVIGAFYLTEEKNCKEGEKNLAKAISLDKFSRLTYYLLYSAYKDCIKDDKRAKKISVDYKATFKSDFFKDAADILKQQKEK